jgi:hypothetical protein
VSVSFARVEINIKMINNWKTKSVIAAMEPASSEA